MRLVTNRNDGSVARLIIGALASVMISAVAVRAGTLTKSGAIGAVASGTVITWRGGYTFAGLLVAFFITSSAMSSLGRARKRQLSEFAEKSFRRDARQVGANGLVATIVAASCSSEAGRGAYIGALAAAAGDTWATEIGGLSRTQPRNLITWHPVSPGVSGGITALGVAASVAGGAFIGLVAAVSNYRLGASRARWREVLTIGAASGLSGSLFDSLLGALIQERRWCPACAMETERRIHVCGRVTTRSGGVPGIDNDVVNLLATFAGAVTGAAITRRFAQP